MHIALPQAAPENAIPFDDRSQMQGDFLCVDARLVIEINGMQQHSTPESWRRDRRKDGLLQFHGFFILRFLADDLSKQLDESLDMVLWSLEHLRRGRNK